MQYRNHTEEVTARMAEREAALRGDPVSETIHEETESQLRRADLFAGLAFTIGTAFALLLIIKGIATPLP